MKTYYELLSLPLKATPGQVQAGFRSVVERYRSTITAEQVFNDPRFHDYLNAYLTLQGELRAQYDKALAQADEKHPPRAPRPYDALTQIERQMLIARVAYWRREMSDTISQLRLLLAENSEYAPAWALLGETYLTIGRLDEGIRGYERAVRAEPENAAYAARLNHARDVVAGKVVLHLEESPEEQRLREERQLRWRITVGVSLVALGVLIFSFFDFHRVPFRGFLEIPWRAVAFQSLGMMILMAALGYGRLLDPFERVMLWSGMLAGHRGAMRSYPTGLLYLAFTTVSMWLTLAVYIGTAIADEEWPISTAIMLGACVVVNILLGVSLHYAQMSWANTLVFGGNVLVLAAMLGWWVGSYSIDQYA